MRTKLSAWTEDELLRLLIVAREHNYRHYAMFLIASLHGLRASEVVSLTSGNFADGFLRVARLKGSRATTQPLLESKNELLNEKQVFEKLLKETKEGDCLFPSGWCSAKENRPMTRYGLNFLCQKYGELAGIPKHKRHAHCAKHYTGRKLADAGVSIEKIKLWLGHESVQSSVQYLQCTDEQAAESVQGCF